MLGLLVKLSTVTKELKEAKPHRQTEFVRLRCYFSNQVSN